MAPTETGKDLTVEEKPESPSYDNADIEVAPAVKDIDVVEGTNNDANDEDYTSSDSEVTRSHVPRPKDPLPQRQAFRINDQARLPMPGRPPMEATVVNARQGRSDWKYHLHDSRNEPVNTKQGGGGYEWIRQQRLIKK